MRFLIPRTDRGIPLLVPFSTKNTFFTLEDDRRFKYRSSASLASLLKYVTRPFLPFPQYTVNCSVFISMASIVRSATSCTLRPHLSIILNIARSLGFLMTQKNLSTSSSRRYKGSGFGRRRPIPLFTGFSICNPLS